MSDSDHRHSEPEHGLAAAVRYFTGKKALSLESGAWPVLRKKLHECPYSAYEYCFFAAYHNGLEAAWQRLTWPNYMCSESVWAAFLVWKEDRMEVVRNIVRLQNHALRCYLRNGFPADELLTGSRMEDMNALVRLENAFCLREEGVLSEEPWRRLVEKHAAAAVELAVGSPEYLHFTPHFRRWASTPREGEQWQALQWQIQRIESTNTR